MHFSSSPTCFVARLLILFVLITGIIFGGVYRSWSFSLSMGPTNCITVLDRWCPNSGSLCNLFLPTFY